MFYLMEHRYDQAVEKACGKALLLSNPAGGTWQEGEKRSHTMKGVVDLDLSEGVMAVCGVLLPKMTTQGDTAHVSDQTCTFFFLLM